MGPIPEAGHSGDIYQDLARRSQIIISELRSRAFWFIKLRWIVPVCLVIGSISAGPLGFQFGSSHLVMGVAVFILCYNLIFMLKSSRLPTEDSVKALRQFQRFIRWQVGFDYFSMFLLIHLTGGVASPLIFFFIFHIIFAAILMPRLSSYGFAFSVVIGMIVIAISEYLGWLPNHTLGFENRRIDLAFQPTYIAMQLLFFSTTVFVTVFSTSSIMNMVRKRISDLVNLTYTVKNLNERLGVLLSLASTIGSARQLKEVLTSVTTQLTKAMDIQGVSVKLLSDDGRFLNYVAAYGLGDTDLLKKRVIEVSRSPLNEAVIKGKPFVASHVTQQELFQFGENLAAARIQSVLFVPLIAEDKVIGILGGYCRQPDKFDPPEIDFFRLAAGLVAMFMDNSMAYEKIEQMDEERIWFMMKVAHNLKAPLSAILSILDVIRGKYLGDLNDDQVEYLRRVHRRAQTMINMVNELLVLAQKRHERQQNPFGTVDLETLIHRIRRTFADEARQKGLDFNIKFPPGLVNITGNAEMLEQMLENLISNAIRYTPTKGRVTVEFMELQQKGIRILISDNGIGIPKASLPRVFEEFYRAKNAQELEEHGTGLGMSIAKEIVTQHGGKISLESEEGLGTLVVIQLPLNNTPE
ncbi:GAF domain-containing sensor histidine kinase [bacterium]|nr:GAF domain-containing sensor histidine kinase [bacterium]